MPIHRHRAIRQHELGAYLNARNEDEELVPGEDNDGDDDGGEDDDDVLSNGSGPTYDEDAPAPRHDSPAPDEIEPAPDNAGPHWGEIDLVALVAQEDEDNILDPVGNPDDMDLDDLDNLFALPPAMPPAPGVLRNPPVAIEEWDEELGLPTPPESEDEAPIGGADQDPEFHEHEERVPEVNEEELWAILWEHLGDLAEQEWIDMYNRVLTEGDRATLRFSAARLRTHFSRSVYEDLRQTVCEGLGLSSDFVAWFRLKVLSNLESVAYD
ncbi:hypothetical protein FRC06_006866 [Ceratobasidium sp. 370]|nr:hypothetical protein FRC06_006866 [Ceratobasidium sp. 370]